MLFLAGCSAAPPRASLPLTPAPATPAEGKPFASNPAADYQPSQMPQATTYWGRPLHAAAPAAHPEAEAKLATAKAAFDERPADPDAIIWYGRRLAYLWDMRSAIAVYSKGLKRHPNAGELYRHRGHRRISLREFDQAIADFERAAALIRGRPDSVEPDGLPNERNIPLTTLGFNVWYHLALARYLTGDFDAALAAWQECAKFTRGFDDNVAAVTYWTYLTLRRLGRDADAARALEPIRADMDILENRAYHALLLLFKGERKADVLLESTPPEKSDFAAVGYGVGMWHLLHGERRLAISTFTRVVSADNWPAFGFIAAEMELKRLGVR
jgi:tetratricopeptide (TPR) repeat protein